MTSEPRTEDERKPGQGMLEKGHQSRKGERELGLVEISKDHPKENEHSIFPEFAAARKSAIFT